MCHSLPVDYIRHKVAYVLNKETHKLLITQKCDGTVWLNRAQYCSQADNGYGCGETV